MGPLSQNNPSCTAAVDACVLLADFLRPIPLEPRFGVCLFVWLADESRSRRQQKRAQIELPVDIAEVGEGTRPAFVLRRLLHGRDRVGGPVIADRDIVVDHGL